MIRNVIDDEASALSYARSMADDERPIVIVDVGAAGGVDTGWQTLPANARVLAFEPDEAECRRLSGLPTRPDGPQVEYIPAALGAARGFAPFFRTVQPHCSSNLRPMEELGDRFPTLQAMAVASETQIALVTLDEWCRDAGVEYVDFIKLDTQGTELDILSGARGVLPTTLILETEVEFNPLYESQPLFGHVDAHLRANGFELWGLEALNHCQMTGLDGGSTELSVRGDGRIQTVSRPAGQLMWAQAFFVRSELLGPAVSDAVTAQRWRAWRIARARGLDDLARTLSHLLGHVKPETVDTRHTAGDVGSGESDHDLRVELAAAREELRQLRSSRSYRFTRPLRVIRSLLPRRRS